MKRTSSLMLCGLGVVILAGILRASPSHATPSRGGAASLAATSAGGRPLASGGIQQTRILYASDWEGPTQIFAVDPTGRRPLGQVTFDHAPACSNIPFACGFTDPLVSANAKTLAYAEVGYAAGASKHVFWVADASGRGAHEVAAVPSWYHEGAPYPPIAAFPGCCTPVRVVSPNRRWVATVDANGITLCCPRNRNRLLTSDATFALSWAPDSKSIAYIQGTVEPPDFATTGDLKIVSLDRRSRTLVRADGPYGGQITALTWTRVPKGTVYRRPLVPASSIFVGGPVGRLAANGTRVAFTACGSLSVWAPPDPTASEIGQLAYVTSCPSPDERTQYYDLAVGRDRVYWGEKSAGLTYYWSLHARTLSTGASFTLADGFTSLGCAWCDGGGALAASGDLTVYGQWQTTPGPIPANRLTTETLFRGTEAGCPCSAIAYGAAPESTSPLIPVDTDGTRIAVLRYGSLVVIDANGNDLFNPGMAAGGAQIMGNSVLVLTDGRLAEYDISSGALEHSWPVPAGTPGRDCFYYSEPHCPDSAVKLQDAALGLVAITVNGQLHVVHLNSGADDQIGYATEARFIDSGLVYADGARINFVPYSRLGG